MSRVAVVGGGTMGNGIAQVFAQSGHEVTLVEVSPERVEAALAKMGGSLDRLVKKGKLDEAGKSAALGRVRGVTSLSDVGRPDLAVEAVVEDFEVKKSVFQTLESACPETTLFATNTSSISITELAATTKRADRFIGMHFMNPVPVMELVEIIRGLATSDDTCRRVVEMSRQLGKTPVEVQDYPGFISNRILMPFINEAIYCLMEGVAVREDIDA
ncbi:MAG: 3-hydroxyacyl-CoA dehydrogenase family protein, partial [Candidatus Rokuibacteriota bacterium]